METSNKKHRSAGGLFVAEGTERREFNYVQILLNIWQKHAHRWKTIHSRYKFVYPVLDMEASSKKKRQRGAVGFLVTESAGKRKLNS